MQGFYFKQLSNEAKEFAMRIFIDEYKAEHGNTLPRDVVEELIDKDLFDSNGNLLKASN